METVFFYVLRENILLKYICELSINNEAENKLRILNQSIEYIRGNLNMKLSNVEGKFRNHLNKFTKLFDITHIAKNYTSF